MSNSAQLVRYRACFLLSIAQRVDALVPLRAALKDGISIEDVTAAIDAIEHKNHNFFADRSRSGKVFINVSPIG
jgi:hypothetical protein